MQYNTSPSPGKMRGALPLSFLLILGAVVAITLLFTPSQLSFWMMETPLEVPGWALSVGAGVLIILACLLVRFLTNSFVLCNEVDRRWCTLLATLLFLLYPSAWSSSTALLTLLPYLGIVFNLYNSYRHPDHPLDLTTAGVFMGLGVLLYPPFIALLPLILFTAIDLRALSLRSSIGFFLELISIFIIATPIVLYSESLPHLQQALQEIVTPRPIWQEGNMLPPPLLIAVAVSTSLYAIATLFGVIRLGEKKVRVRQLMAAQMRPALMLPLGIFYSQHLVGLSLLSLIPASMVMVLAFPAHERKVRSFWLIVLILSLLVVWSLPFFS